MQVGDPRRILVALIQGKVEHIVNPVIEQRSGSYCMEEACLSFPELWVPVERSNYVLVGYKDAATGEDRKIIATELEAVILQHEMDHLDGKTILDHANRDTRRPYMKKFKQPRRFSRKSKRTRR